MIVRFSKNRHGPVLVCIRDDGSVTGMKDGKHGAFFLRHDLMHYAVESVLGFRQAFYGLLAAGRSVDSFNAPGSGKTLPREVVLTEFIVGAIDRRLNFSEPVDAAAITAEIRASWSDCDDDEPTLLSQAACDQIVKIFAETYSRFHELTVGKHMDLLFPSQHVRRNGAEHRR